MGEFDCFIQNINKISISVLTQKYLLENTVYVFDSATCFDLSEVTFRLLKDNKNILRKIIYNLFENRFIVYYLLQYVLKYVYKPTRCTKFL